MAFVLAAGMIVLGIAQRTVFLEPASTSLSATIADEARYAVIESSALTAFDGSQTVTVTGADTVFLAYGRSSDVKAWLGDSPYADIRQARNAPRLSSKIVEAPAAEAADAASSETAAPVAETITNPAGSDMWLQEFTAKKTLTTTVHVPEGISLIVASDGTAPAPTTVTLSWPVDNSTPWAGPLIAGGGIVALLGLVMYLLALLHLRRSHGPRRNLPRGPRMPRLPRVPRPKAIKASEITGSRRSVTRSMVRVVPVVLVSGLLLSGCSADFWPSAPSAPKASVTATPGATDLPAAEDVPPPAVSVPQLERIVSDISRLSTDADAKLDAEAIATRFTGPALAERLANYKVRAVDPALKAVPALPAAPLTLKLPQQSSNWPRVVLTVIQDKAAPTVAPLALVLRQESPRADYLVEYAMQLEPAAKVPDVAPASIGAPIIAPDSKLLALPPGEVAAAYADILMQGEASPSFGLFEAEGDTFRTQVATLRADRIGKLSKTASLEFATAVGKGSTVALATNDSGSIVAVSLTETETAKILDGGATVQTEGASKALSGVEKTAKGIQSVYGDQLLFHVPAAGSKEKIVLLGIAQGLISSSEIP
ncbi:hypothetical protein E3T26_13200 [Cryobacterium sp. TMT1-21]|uniref:DUF8094 domain-containing protein n=1 Tax=Cryobacterium shii TaxID=1259235 RepID=A0AAQ2HGT5_9MICO|nr:MULTISPECIES: hypothetical protein [Cryobacterium]TFC52385.1 hypothetical protein E3O49_01675 [Cryobacterium shii]TFC87485.1 hypothetical protein E3T24_04645 [Cryobacterium sp. TmT2-59]TFD10849.1 hypothetical protein E3T26_13200 [Cryobacterium sp. TMT1-21]TFD16545.1 hypothetical protein E3T32_15290 [Cryobacterium sp. TMT2-23]TFD20514.1 hypothetical protein E3T42_02505 [Cryobacterium sp. TMT4-10]